MFDRAVCALARIGGSPQVDIGTLYALAELLRAAKPVSALLISVAASEPHDSYSGGFNAAQVHDVAARSIPRPARFRDHTAAAMADLPAQTRETLTPLIVRLLLDYVDGDPIAQPREAGDDL